MLLLCSLFISCIKAADVPSETDSNASVTSENPVLIATEDLPTDGTPNLIQPRDNSTQPPIDSSNATQSESAEDLLISTKSDPDYTGYTVAFVSLVAVVAVALSVVVLKRVRK